MAINWQVFIDGAARGNPGKAGAGIYIKTDDQDLIKTGLYLGEKTNNQAEYLSLLLAIFFLKKEFSKNKIDLDQPNSVPKITFFSDSELLVKQIKGEYKVKNAILLQLKNLADTFLDTLDYKIQHVLREKNKIADKLANVGIDKKKELPVSFCNWLSKNQIDI